MSAAGFALTMHSLPQGGEFRARVRGNRPLQAALFASAVLHAMALGWLPGLDRVADRAPLPLRILLPLPVDMRPEIAPPPAVAPAPTSAPRSTAAAPVPAPQPMRRVPADDALPVPAVRAEDPPPAALPIPAPPPPAAPVAAVPLHAAPAAPDPQALAGYGRSVAGALASHQRYPRIAQMRQWQGTTVLQLEFAADGRLLETRVLSSSGHDVLDRQALDMLRAALPLPPPPVPLAGRPLVVNVPVVFRLAG